ncbi:hypothetical protein VPAG_00016 [Vibrio phage douglas 12A4]|uniref:hypothetical protein n=1 Tax=Vibrio phage douglas 12A4 TaxID=573171 RepID=UPI0002C0AC9D|nr:hypothetical protein VPAG_00016 [Vibrio phage douglas 12A4]AGG58052.1 hypothetical protein VPAG_00016 [Vibrio phage douglas 12A4]
MKHLGNLKDKLPKKTKSKKPTSAQTKIEKEKKKSSVIKLHAKVQRHLVGLPPYEKEVMFHPTRKWRMDYAWPDLKIAVEIHGGIFSGGRHTTGVGFIADREKMNEAQLLGWIVLELAPDHLDRMKDMVERAIALRGEQCIQ